MTTPQRREPLLGEILDMAREVRAAEREIQAVKMLRDWIRVWIPTDPGRCPHNFINRNTGHCQTCHKPVIKRMEFL